MEVGTDPIHLVYEGHPRYSIPIGLPPHCFRLWLYTSHSAENSYYPVQYSQASFNFDSKVDMPGSVNDVDFSIFPETGGRCRGYGDSPLLFLFHPVHDGCAFMNLTNLVRLAGIIQYPLSRRCLSRVNMGHYADIARVRQLFAMGRHRRSSE
jgi:hypothetical protein